MVWPAGHGVSVHKGAAVDASAASRGPASGAWAASMGVVASADSAASNDTVASGDSEASIDGASGGSVASNDRIASGGSPPSIGTVASGDSASRPPSAASGASRPVSAELSAVVCASGAASTKTPASEQPQPPYPCPSASQTCVPSQPPGPVHPCAAPGSQEDPAGADEQAAKKSPSSAHVRGRTVGNARPHGRSNVGRGWTRRLRKRAQHSAMIFIYPRGDVEPSKRLARGPFSGAPTFAAGLH